LQLIIQDTLTLQKKLNMKPIFLVLSGVLFLTASCQSCSGSQETESASQTEITKESNLTKVEASQVISASLATRKAELKEQYQTAWNSKTFTVKEAHMRFAYKIFGEAPEGGHSLYISMHGGGNSPVAVNDQQWENQKRLYEPAEGVYLAPRAPGNTWDLWHVAVIDPLMDEVIEACQAYLDINPNKVYIMGYSAGGDGCYQLAPRLAERWAAAAMMAGHPGDAQASNLRNVPFTLWVGANDAAYDRNRLVPVWNKALDALQASDAKGYIHDAHVVADKGHWMDREDRAAVPWMAKYTRNPYPNKIVWTQDDIVRATRYWVQLPTAELVKGGETVVSYAGQTITIEKCFTSEMTFWLNDSMLNLDKPVKVVYQGKTLVNERVPRSQKAIKDRINQHYDTAEQYSANLTVKTK